MYDASNHYAIASVYSCLATCYRDLENPATALSYCEKALASCAELDLAKEENMTLQTKISEKQSGIKTKLAQP